MPNMSVIKCDKQTTDLPENNDELDLKCSLEAIKLNDLDQLENKNFNEVLHLIVENGDSSGISSESDIEEEEVEIAVRLLASVYDFLIQSTQSHHECIAIVFYDSNLINFYTMISFVINDVVEFLLSNKFDVTFNKIVFASFNHIKMLENVLESTKSSNNRFVCGN